MATLWKIAARNVLRNKRRTAITGIVMTVGIAMFIMSDAMLQGMDRMTIDNMVDYTESFLKVRTPAYVANLQATPLDYGIPNPETVMNSILAYDGRLKAAAPRLRFVASVSNYVDSMPVLATAVDPARDGLVFSMPGSISEGVWLDRAEPGSVVLGSGLAAELGLGVGDWFILSATTAYDNVNADEYRVAGLAFSPMPEINDGGVFIGFADADALLGTSGLVTEIAVSAEGMPNLDSLLAASTEIAGGLSARLPGLQTDSIRELAKDYLAMRAMKGKASYFIILIVLLIAAVGIVNTILMSVYARIREIGVLRAYGMSPKEIKRLFTLEGVIVGAVGSAAGVALGALTVWWMASVGVDIASLIGDIDMGGLPLKGTLYAQWNPATMAFGFAFGLFVAFLAARIPARKASRLEVTDALRFA